MKKHFGFKSDKQIFRILITETDKLVIETRDTNTKEVSFHCFELNDGKSIFTDLQLEEKIWLGIEAIYKDVIYFHKFPKPDMPGHREIIAFDIASQKVIWQNDSYAFSFVHQDKVYCFTQGFEERFFYTLDYLTGEVKEDLKNDYSLVNSIRSEAEGEKDWSDYIYPELNLISADAVTYQIIKQFTEGFSLAGEIEWASSKDLSLFSFHTKEKDEKLTNRFAVISKSSGETILFETINENITALLTDSFFVYKNYVFVLKGKNEVEIQKID
ncbi:MAG: DUF4905 domain-containing protein [Melioribacteraceae bacterium]